MASTGKCRYCDSTITSNDQKCPSCGAPNPNYVEDLPRKVTKPQTIEELKEYCAERGMPLLRMRFFIGEDFWEARAFGIYREGDRFIVYKNKSDGSRAIRYQGPDEAYAVNELYLKLLSECHNRGIYPDGTPKGQTYSNSKKSFSDVFPLLIQPIIGILLLFLIVFFSVRSCAQHKNDGYYDFNDNKIWYRHGSDWFYTYDNSYDDDWYEGNAPVILDGEYDDYYQGRDFDYDWGITDFKESDTYDEHYGSDSDSGSGSDYGGWDSSDTDWDSDW